MNNDAATSHQEIDENFQQLQLTAEINNHAHPSQTPKYSKASDEKQQESVNFETEIFPLTKNANIKQKQIPGASTTDARMHLNESLLAQAETEVPNSVTTAKKQNEVTSSTTDATKRDDISGNVDDHHEMENRDEEAEKDCLISSTNEAINESEIDESGIGKKIQMPRLRKKCLKIKKNHNYSQQNPQQK